MATITNKEKEKRLKDKRKKRSRIGTNRK